MAFIDGEIENDYSKKYRFFNIKKTQLLGFYILLERNFRLPKMFFEIYNLVVNNFYIFIF